AFLVADEIAARITDKRPVHHGPVIHRVQREARRKASQHAQPTGRCQRCKTCIGDLMWQTDVNIQSEGSRDFVLEELPEATMAPVNATHQLALVEAECECMVGLTRPWRPGRLLTREH